jgi:hypothetical protein
VGPAIAAAVISAPIGPVAGAIYVIATHFDNRYHRELETNALVRELGHEAIDPLAQSSLWTSAFLWP